MYSYRVLRHACKDYRDGIAARCAFAAESTRNLDERACRDALMTATQSRVEVVISCTNISCRSIDGSKPAAMRGPDAFVEFST
jgi:hypothetical protein